MKHTPGPWQTGSDNHGNGYYSEWLTIETSTFDLIAKTPEQKGITAQDEANARLIAAAPELLQACLQVRILLRASGMLGLHLETVEQAITKAQNDTNV